MRFVLPSVSHNILIIIIIIIYFFMTLVIEDGPEVQFETCCSDINID